MTQYKEAKLLDITAPEECNIVWSIDKSTLWVNVDGMCVLRVCRIPELTINGRRQCKREKKS